jgi:hypothetical protein
MKRLVRLTEEDLMKVMHNSVQRALQEHYIDIDREIRLAQKELYQMGQNLSSVGMRLEGTKYHALYKRMADAMIELNQQLIKHIRGEK